jgi:hypothetical protein
MLRTTVGLPLGSFLLLVVNSSFALAQPKPLLAVPGEVIVQDDFSIAHPLDKRIWQRRQGTRWEIENGVLRGQQSSPEFQASKKDHFGYEPRLSIPVTPAEFVASFSIRFIDGKETSIVPFIEFGHHVCRVRFSKQGASLLAEKESLKLAEATDFVWESGKQYRMTAEMKDAQFVLQIEDGPTLFGEHPSFAQPPSSGGAGFGVAGPKKGFVEIDDLVIQKVKPTTQASWPKRKAMFPAFTPVEVKKTK